MACVDEKDDLQRTRASNVRAPTRVDLRNRSVRGFDKFLRNFWLGSTAVAWRSGSSDPFRRRMALLWYEPNHWEMQCGLSSNSNMQSPWWKNYHSGPYDGRILYRCFALLLAWWSSAASCILMMMIMPSYVFLCGWQVVAVVHIFCTYSTWNSNHRTVRCHTSSDCCDGKARCILPQRLKY